MEEQPNEDPKAEDAADKNARVQEWVKEMEARVRERLKQVEQTIRTEYRDAVPHDVSAHLQKSKEEFLLAVRKIVDRQIEKTRKQPQKQADNPASDESASDKTSNQ